MLAIALLMHDTQHDLATDSQHLVLQELLRQAVIASSLGKVHLLQKVAQSKILTIGS